MCACLSRNAGEGFLPPHPSGSQQAALCVGFFAGGGAKCSGGVDPRDARPLALEHPPAPSISLSALKGREGYAIPQGRPIPVGGFEHAGDAAAAFEFRSPRETCSLTMPLSVVPRRRARRTGARTLFRVIYRNPTGPYRRRPVPIAPIRSFEDQHLLWNSAMSPPSPCTGLGPGLRRDGKAFASLTECRSWGGGSGLGGRPSL